MSDIFYIGLSLGLMLIFGGIAIGLKIFKMILKHERDLAKIEKEENKK